MGLVANIQASGAGRRGKAWPVVDGVMVGSQRLDPAKADSGVDPWEARPVLRCSSAIRSSADDRLQTLKLLSDIPL